MKIRRSKGLEDGTRAEGGLSVSFLVRAREEKAESGATSLRIFVRNLQTGREQYLNDPAQLGELVLRHLREARQDESGAEDRPGQASRTGS
jgi:hypothetical protein